NRVENVRDAIARGDDLMDTAEILFRAGKYADAVSRAYYAIFHFARALLLKRGIEAKSHGGIGRLLQREVVRTGDLTPESGATFSKLMALRHDADYDAVVVISSAVARAELDAARAFIADARRA